MALYFLLIGGVGAVQDWRELADRSAWAEFIAYVCLLLLGPVTYISAHLVATSARRSGANAQIDAAPMERRRRDLALCLGVLIGPVVVALGLALLGAWLASGVVFTDPDGPTIVEWSVTDVAQVPALVLGAGILGVVVARWLHFPGSLLVGFLGMCALTLWMMAPPLPAARPWFSWFALISWFSDVDSGSHPHAVDGVARRLPGGLVLGRGVRCRPAPRRGSPALVPGPGSGVIVLAATGVAQLPDM